MWGSEFSFLLENFSGKIIFQSVGSPLACAVFDFIAVVPLVPSCGFFGCGASFVVGSRVLFLMVLLLMVVQQVVVILVFP